MELKLKKPLAFFDLETTGINISADRIVEISILKVLPNAEEQVYTKRINPLMPIPAESSMFHGIYDEDIIDAPTFQGISQEVADFIGDADLAGYNSNKFDIPMLMEEFLRSGVDFSLENRVFVDVQNIFHQMEQRTLKAAYKFYCNESLENAHSAEADVRATYEVLKAQLTKYEGAVYEDKHGKQSVPVVNDVPALSEFTNMTRPVDFAGRIVYNDEGVEVINFGKHKGRPVTEVFDVEPSYYAWMQNGDFPLYTKKCLENIWNSHRQAKRAAKSSEPIHAPEDKKQAKKEFQKQENKSEKREITNDMLAGLKNKFG
ncbi:DNA polymerase III subunit epsilon [Sphingobacterium sp. ML3W]|uniref:3'-5' exonuclease n=1 Tax=Sphingobacterium sp. ML3W TaxID=1538644 RepID=UPI0004F74758|nr:3'-5' exonuclease [Sphingobacterium sp. ML3W]AIM36934.1 DNA polymerase III subunit epsilon [Sphingobacterium sp. ML3W]